jgi:hypothetical protein
MNGQPLLKPLYLGRNNPQYPLSSRLRGPQNQYGRFGVKPTAPARILTPDYPARSLVTTLTMLFRLFVLDMIHYFVYENGAQAMDESES